VSLVVLGATAAFQVVIVVVSGSVALLADSVHNVGDALTAFPLGVAFLLLRRGRTRRLTYGYGRAENFAGLAVVAIILFSALYAAFEAIRRPAHLRGDPADRLAVESRSSASHRPHGRRRARGARGQRRARALDRPHDP
jgi:cation diffusion facilitator family transporter